jgi:hypothetical protein
MLISYLLAITGCIANCDWMALMRYSKRAAEMKSIANNPVDKRRMNVGLGIDWTEL